MFATFEGIEGAGKSTIMQMLASRLEAEGRQVVLTREPGGSNLGARLRSILLDMRTGSLADNAELFLFLADRAQHVEDVIRPALAAGKILLCDRYTDSTIAYQAYGRGENAQMLQEFNLAASSGLEPDVTFLLDLPVREGLARASLRNRANGTIQSEGRFDSETVDFHERVRNGYLELARQNLDRIMVVNATSKIEKVVEDCYNILEAALQKMQKY